MTKLLSIYVSNVSKMFWGQFVSLQSQLFEPYLPIQAYVTGLLEACRINSFKTWVVHSQCYPKNYAGRERVK